MKSVDDKTQQQSDSDEELWRQEMECPVCFCTQFSPVRQCPNGHTLCDDCSKHSACKKCPTCRAAPTSIRCLGNLTLLSISLSFSLVLLSVPPDPTHARTQTYYECRCSEEFLMHLYVILIVDVGAWFLGGSVRAVLDKVDRHLRWT